MKKSAEHNPNRSSDALSVALAHALPVVTGVLALFYRWFAVADRYVIFLYCHDMGPLVPDTAPFSFVTASRYWVAGLVASGVVLVFYATFTWVWRRIDARRRVARYRPPTWWRVWAICAVCFVIGIPAITMTVNAPTLPLGNAVQVTVVTVIGVALALAAAQWMVDRPLPAIVLLAADGFGLMFFPLNLVILEERANPTWLWMMVVMLVIGVFWLGGMTLVRTLWARKFIVSGRELFVAEACVSYLLMPLVHHVAVGTLEGYFYISNSDNFFSESIALQIGVWIVSAGVAFGVAKVRAVLLRKGVRPTLMKAK